MKKFLATAALAVASIAASPAAAQQVNLAYNGGLTVTGGLPGSPFDTTLNLTGTTDLSDILNGNPVTVNVTSATDSLTGALPFTTLTANYSNNLITLFDANGTNLFSFSTNVGLLESTGSASATITAGNQGYTIPGIGLVGFQGGTGTLTASIAAVPEPATWAMMLVGFGGMGLVMRRKRAPALAQVA